MKILLLLVLDGLLAAQTPSDGAGWFNLGLTQHASGAFDDAIQSFQKALDLQYNVPGCMMRTARAYARKNEIDKAVDWMKRSAGAGFTALVLLGHKRTF